MRQVHRVADLRQRGLGVVRLWGSPESLYLVCDLDGAPWLIACPAGMAGSSSRSTPGERGALVTPYNPPLARKSSLTGQLKRSMIFLISKGVYFLAGRGITPQR